MLKILVISPWLPWPPYDGARIRILETVRHLARRHQVTLLAHIHEESDRDHVAKLRDLGVSVEVSRLPQGAARRIARSAASALTGKALIQGLHFDRGLARMIAAETRERAYDVVQLELSLIARYASAVDRRHRPKLILSTHNVESQRFARELELTPFWSLRHLVLGVDARFFPRWEERALQAFDGAVAVSADDQAWLQERFAGRPVALAPNGVDTAAFAPDREPAPRRRAIVFTGVMDYPPNEDAVVWFAERVWPELRRATPDLEFHVVGTRPTAKVAALASRPGIQVTGEVPDVKPYVSGALAFVVPLRSGGGTRLKILQAMAMGCPVISTRLGAEGLDVVDGEHLLYADAPAEFVAQLDSIAGSAERAERLARNARQRVVERYDWSRCLEPLDDLYRQVLQ